MNCRQYRERSDKPHIFRNAGKWRMTSISGQLGFSQNSFEKWIKAGSFTRKLNGLPVSKYTKGDFVK